MKLELGKQYRNRKGRVTSPLELVVINTLRKFGAWVQETDRSDLSWCEWHADGRFLGLDQDSRWDLVEVYDPTTNPQPDEAP